MNLDRFVSGLPDPQNIPAVTNCDNCGGEIYPGEWVATNGQEIVHEEESHIFLPYEEVDYLLIEDAIRRYA